MEDTLQHPQGSSPKDSSNNQLRKKKGSRFLPDLENQHGQGHSGHSAMSKMRHHLVAFSGEFVGTILFLFFAFGGTQIANSIQPPEPTLDKLLYISLSFGFSLATTAWTFYRISGGLFNPAVQAHWLLFLKADISGLIDEFQVTFGLIITGTLPWLRGLILLPAQLLGGIAAAALVSCLFPTPLVVETSLGNGTSIAQGLFIEAFLTAELLITILMLAAEKSRATFIAPIGIGLALFIAELTGLSFFFFFFWNE